MKKKLWLVGIGALSLVIVIGVIILANVSGGNPYKKLSIASNAARGITMSCEVSNTTNGVALTGQTTRSFTVTVKNAPKIAGNGVTASSDNDNIVKVVGEPVLKGKTSTITIQAVNGGTTDIRVMTVGGGVFTLVPVTVNIPAKAIALRDGVQFGIIRPTSDLNKGAHTSIRNEIVFDENDFIFSAFKGVSGFTPTVNSVSYSLQGTADGCTINGNKFSVSYVPEGKYKVKAYLTRYPDECVFFDVWVFAPFTDANNKANAQVVVQGGGKKTTLAGEPLADLVTNKYDESNGLVDMREVEAKSPAHEARYNEITNTWQEYGYEAVNRNESVAKVLYDDGQGFSIAATGVGETWIDVVYYPIATDGSSKYAFDDPVRYAHLQKTKSIKVEVRNVFPENYMRFARNGNPISGDLNAFYGGTAAQNTQQFNIRLVDNAISTFNSSTPESVIVSATENTPGNNAVVFALSGTGVVPQTPIEQYLTIMANGVKVTQSRMDAGLVPYGANFTIALANNSFGKSLIGKSDLKLTISSYEGTGSVRPATSPFSTNFITLNASYGIDEISAFMVSGNVSGGAGTDDKITGLYPMNEKNAEYYFDIGTDVGEDAAVVGNFAVEFIGEGDTLFTVGPPSVVGGKIRYFVKVKGTPDPMPEVGKNYPLRVTYANGMYADLAVEALEKITSLDVKVRAVDNAFVYNQTQEEINVGFKLVKTAHLKVGGTYELMLGAGNASVWYEVGGAKGNTFTVTSGMTGSLGVKLCALNPAVLADAALTNDSFSINLTVVNPVQAVNLSANNFTLYSPQSLGDGDNSFKKTVNLQLTYAANTDASGRGDITITQKDNQGFVGIESINATSFEVIGKTARVVTVTLEVEQTFGSVVTSKTTMKLVVNIVDAVQVSSVKLLDMGDTLTVVLPAMQGATQPAAPPKTLLPSIYPVNAYNGALGYAFEVEDTGGKYKLVQAVGDYVSVNKTTGVLTATKSNSLDGTVITLVIYALDSLHGGNYYVGGATGKVLAVTHTKINVIILKAAEADGGTFIISNRAQFLDAFYVEVGGVYKSKNYISNDPIKGFYQLVADIDLAGLKLEPIRDFRGWFLGTYSSGGVRAQYSLYNFTVNVTASSDVGYVSGNNHHYGLFGVVEEDGRIEGIGLKNVFMASTQEYTGKTNLQTNIGLIAAVNNGTIRDVVVEIGYFYWSAKSMSEGSGLTFNIGHVAGINNGTIEETYRLNTTGLIQVNSAAWPKINIGGIAGLNSGTIKGISGSKVLGENVNTNSDASVSLLEHWTNDVTEKNIGGIAGENEGTIDNVSSENVLLNFLPGNKSSTGGLVGKNTGTVKNSYSNSVLYGCGAIGGLVGNNSGQINDSYYDFYINTNVQASLNYIMFRSSSETALNWSVTNVANQFYAGIIVDNNGSNNDRDATAKTVVGGVVGVNSGNLTACFASSAFAGNSVEYVLGAPYKGDIYLYGAQKIIVGGVVGRQVGTSASTIKSCYSNLELYYDYHYRETTSPYSIQTHNDGAPLFGGLVGWIDSGANVSFTGCYADNYFDLTVSAVVVDHATTPLVIGGLLGRNTVSSSSTTGARFSYCYSTLNKNDITWSAAKNDSRIDSIFVSSTYNAGNVAPYFNSVMCAIDGTTSNCGLTVGSLGKNVAGLGAWSGADAYFIAYDDTDTVNYFGYDYPLVKATPTSTTPLVIAKPNVNPDGIKLRLKPAGDYVAIYGQYNNRGGFNFVVPEDNTKYKGDTGYANNLVHRAALFYTAPVSGVNLYASYSIEANKYFLDDIFDVEVSPLIASKRVAVELRNNDCGAKLGVENNKYYVTVARTGSFDIRAVSTRNFAETGAGYVFGDIEFDVVEGISATSVNSDISGEISRKNIARDIISSVPVSVQRGAEFSFSASTNSNAWGITASWEKTNATPASGTYVNASLASDNSTLWAEVKAAGANKIFQFVFTPQIEVGSSTYTCEAFAIDDIYLYVYSGAIELKLKQEKGSTDGASGIMYSGTFISDLTRSWWVSSTPAVDKLRDLNDFYFNWNGMSKKLFEDGATTKIDDLFDSDAQGFSLMFELFVESVVDPYPAGGLYTLYKFSIHVSVVIDPAFYIKEKGELEELVKKSAITNGLKGTIFVYEVTEPKETLPNGMFVYHKQRTTSADLEVFAQGVQTLNFQHFAKAEKHLDDKNALTVEENQQQNMNLFTEATDNEGLMINADGLLRVVTSPYYASVSKLTLESTIYKQAIPISWDKKGKADDWVYKEWQVGFLQYVMVEEWNEILEQYVPSERYEMVPDIGKNTDAGTKKGFVAYPVSAVRKINGKDMYVWNGTFYVNTYLADLTPSVAKGEKIDPEEKDEEGKLLFNGFNITAVISALDVSRDADKLVYSEKDTSFGFNLGVMKRPGAYIRIPSTVAVGLDTPFSIDKVGDVSSTPVVKIVTAHPAVIAANGGAGAPLTDILSIPANEDVIGWKVKLEITYTIINEFGDTIPGSNSYDIDIVLYKVTGFSIKDYMGNTIRLLNSSRRGMTLVPNTERFPYSDGTPAEQDLSNRIDAAVATLEEYINYRPADYSNSRPGDPDRSEWLEWRCDGGKLNNPSLLNGEYYYNSYDGMNFALGRNSTGKFISPIGFEGSSKQLTVEMFYTYNDGELVISDSGGSLSVMTVFNVVTNRQDSSEDNPIPIYNAAQFRDWLASVGDSAPSPNGQYYILMNDITLYSWGGGHFIAAGLDGNNKRVYVDSFGFDARGNYGLFSTIPDKSIIKNLNIVIPKNASTIGQPTMRFDITNTNITDNVANIGALAGTNKGVVTNCAVLVDEQFEPLPIKDSQGNVIRTHNIANYDKTTYDTNKKQALGRVAVFVADKPGLTVNFGGLVGTNSGTISNSRVMVDLYMGPENGSVDTIKISTNSNMGGMVGKNSGTIVSGLFRDANILNNTTTSSGSTHRTGGFAGENTITGKIRACYALGVSDEYNLGSGNFGTVKEGNISSVLNVAGFVYNNSGEITDCYVNVRLKSKEGVGVAGFVWTNSSAIENCFVNNSNELGQITYYAFEQSTTGQGIVNCYFVNASRFSSGSSSSGVEPLTEGNIGTPKTAFGNFSLGDENNTWTYNIINGYTIGIKPTGADDIATSIRIEDGVSGWSTVFVYESGFEYGSAKNPVIIYNGEKFNQHIYSQTAEAEDEKKNANEKYEINFEKNVYQGNIRLVNNILLNEKDKEVNLQTFKVTFKGVLDGNGFEISDITANAANVADTLKSVGLFSKLEYATIRNINLKFASDPEYAVTGGDFVTYVGGLAGIAINSNLIDIEVTGTKKISGISIVGGVVGAAVYFSETDNDIYRIENVTSNIQVESRRNEGRSINLNYSSGRDYFTSNNYGDLGIAGGVFGIIINKPASIDEEDWDILMKDKSGASYNTYDAVKPAAGSVFQNISNTHSGLSVQGTVVGGLFGAIGKDITIKEASFIRTSGEVTLHGKAYVGGIVGINLGILDSATIDFGSSGSLDIKFGTMESLPPPYIFKFGDTTEYGMVVGGVAGSNGGTISNATMSVNISNSDNNNILVIGGIVGENYGGIVTGNIVKGTVLSGMYLGGIVGVHSGVGGEISNNNVDVESWSNLTNWTNSSNTELIYETFIRDGMTTTEKYRRTYTGLYLGYYGGSEPICFGNTKNPSLTALDKYNT